MLSEISQSQEDRYCILERFHLHDIPGVVKLLETERRMVGARDWERVIES